MDSSVISDFRMVDFMRKTAEKHSSRGLGVQPHLYDLWRKSLITTIEQHDSSFGEELRTIWHKCLTDSIEIMKARY